MSFQVGDWDNEDCMVCGKHMPPGHAVVLDPTQKDWRKRRAGRVCASHTLAELALDSQERFLVEIMLSDVAVNCTERTHAKNELRREDDAFRIAEKEAGK